MPSDVTPMLVNDATSPSSVAVSYACVEALRPYSMVSHALPVSTSSHHGAAVWRAWRWLSRRSLCGNGVREGLTCCVPSVVVGTRDGVRTRADVGGLLTGRPTYAVAGTAVPGVGVEARGAAGGAFAHASSFARHLLVVKTAPPLTPTIPKPGALGIGLAH